MLAEWLQYLLTPCPKHLRVLGYPQEIIATQARYRRCKEAWRPHLENTKSFILENAATASSHSTAVILGSGSLLDVPLAELSQRFEQIILVDILHLPWVKRHALRYPNVRFQELDVTGVCETVVDEVKQMQGAPLKLPQVLPMPLTQSLGVTAIDFLASVNLLSQLPIMPCAYLEKHRTLYSEEDREDFARALIENHLQLLQASAGQVCLITDLEWMSCDQLGKVVEREDAVGKVKLPKPDKEWLWDIAPHPEMHSDRDLRHRIGGYANLRGVDLALSSKV